MRESETMTMDDYEVQCKLCRLLGKLNIKSAQAAIDPWEDTIMRAQLSQFGRPNQLLMDPASLAVFQKAFGKP
jgi:hypothetical protein